MEEREERTRKEPLALDWDKLLPPEVSDDKPPPSLVIVKFKSLDGDMESSASMDQMTDRELEAKIERLKITLPKLAPTLTDKGEKLRSFLKRLEDHRDYRNLHRKPETIQLEEPDEFERPVQSLKSDVTGKFKGSRRETATRAREYDCSTFSDIFMERINGDARERRPNALRNEISLLSPCDRNRRRSDNESGLKRKHGNQSGARQSPPKRRHCDFSRERGKQALSNGRAKDTRASSACFEDIRENSSNIFYEKRKDSWQGSNSREARLRKVHNFGEARPRKEETIVLLDEEEPKPAETLELPEKPDISMKDVKIYYPSREHPESVEISYTDFDCLAPEAYLRSNVMNFYIRYLQQHASPTNSVMHNCHFFNTYFYNKLKEVLSRKRNSRDEFFLKFRRWWKGINIFNKEYILIPINADVHWSLAIICNPDREMRSRSVVLHLDSLELHSSSLVFQNIKSFLQQEWTHLCREEASCSDPPSVNQIWETLPRRIDEHSIKVPQQKNDYDCGLFVLYFMERFIEESPGWLKEKKDLARFGRQWFKPEEASGLRGKILKLLMKEFKKTQKTPPSSPSSLQDIWEV